jgi:hypothetical protein
MSANSRLRLNISKLASLRQVGPGVRSDGGPWQFYSNYYGRTWARILGCGADSELNGRTLPVSTSGAELSAQWPQFRSPLTEIAGSPGCAQGSLQVSRLVLRANHPTIMHAI